MKKLFLSIVFLFLCLAVYGQHHNIYAGISPYASFYKLNLKNDGDNPPLSYSPYVSGSLEYQTKVNLGSLNISYASVYISYGKGKFDENTAELYSSAPQSEVSDFSINVLIGTIINEYGRFQIPLAIGPGLLKFQSGPFSDSSSYQVVAKAGATFFVTDRLGVYAGGRFEHELGGHKNALLIEGGLVYSLGDR